MQRHRFHLDRRAPWWIQGRGTSGRTTKANLTWENLDKFTREQTSLPPATARRAPSGENTVTLWVPIRMIMRKKDREHSLESHLGPYPVFQRRKQTLSYTRQSVVPSWHLAWQTHLSSSRTPNTRQFKFSPFSTFSAVLFIPHTKEDS
jgi:hypothetical protein